MIANLLYFSLGCIFGYVGIRLVCFIDKIIRFIDHFENIIQNLEKGGEEIYIEAIHYMVDLLIDGICNKMSVYKEDIKDEIISFVPSVQSTWKRADKTVKNAENKVVDVVKKTTQIVKDVVQKDIIDGFMHTVNHKEK
jgi:hypothetical protein